MILRLFRHFLAVFCLAVSLAAAEPQAPPPTPRRLVVGVDRAFPPFHYAEADGKARGYDVDLLAMAAREAGLEPEFRTGSWVQVKTWFDQGEVDVLSALFSSEERRKQYALSVPHTLVSFALVRRIGDPLIQTESDLKGKRILVQTRDVMSERLQNAGIDLVRVDTYVEAMRRVLAGEADAAVLPKLVALKIAHTEHLKGFTLQDGLWPPQRFCFAARKDQAHIIERLNEGLVVLRENGQSQALWDRHFEFLQDQPVPFSVILRRTLWVLVPIAMLALAALAMAAILRRMVQRRTLELQQELAARRQAEDSLTRYKEHLEELVAERTLALEESTHQFSQLVSQLPETVIIHREGRMVYANEAASKLTGFPLEELLGKPLLECIHADDHAEVLDHLRQGEAGDTSAYEARLQTHSGEVRNILVKAKLTTFHGLPAALSIMEDITWHRQMEQELREAKEAAEAADRAKSQFLANMSHEIRTPLNAVIGFAELLHTSVQDPSLLGYTENIRAAGRNLLTLIGDILDLSKIEAGLLEICTDSMDLRAFLREQGQIYALRAREKGLELKVEVADDLPDALGLDAVRIRQVLVNLVGNAIKFTDSGSVWINARALPLKDPGGLDLLLEVRDTGIGIPKEAQESIFEPFRQQAGQSNRIYGGTGLGLSISRKLVDLMGGRLEVESELGRGSTFRIYLPYVRVSAIQDAASPFPARSSTDGLRPFQPNRVLVADDILSNRQLVTELLLKVSLDPLQAQDGVEAIETVRRERPALVLMDIQMPRMDGIQAMRILKADAATRDIPIIAYTASSKILETSDYAKFGFDGFLIKPVSIETLLKELARHLPMAPDVPGISGSVAPAPLSLTGVPLPEDVRIELAPVLEACQGAIRPERLRRLIGRMRELATKEPRLEAWAKDLEGALSRFDLPAIENLLASIRET